MATTELTESDLGLLNELKVDLVHRITEIDDLETIKEVFVCLRQSAPETPEILTPELMEQLDADLEQGRKDYAEGRWITQDQLKEKIVRWRKEKEK